MHGSVISLVVAFLVPLQAAALCVANDTDGILYFTAATREGDLRTGAYLRPGQDLCLAEISSGVVAAFETETSIEGCSRLAVDGDRLKRFARFDRCTWASQLAESGGSDG